MRRPATLPTQAVMDVTPTLPLVVLPELHGEHALAVPVFAA